MSFYRNKRVLVAGGTGTIGIPLTKQLIGAGADVTVASNHSKEHAARVLGRKVSFIHSDLSSQKKCREVVKEQEIVFNLIGIKGSVGIGQSKVASYLVSMLRFQTNLMEAAHLENASRFLFVSSICCYPQNDIHYEDNAWNGMPKQNDRIPGIEKRVGELQGEAYQLETGWDAVRVVRPSNVFGPHDDFNPKTAQVIPALISRICGGESPLRVWGDGSSKRDFIFSEDCAYWMLKALEMVPSNTPINLGSGEAFSIKHVVELLCLLIGNNTKIEWDKTKPSGDKIRLLAMDRAREIIGFYPRTSLADGLKKTVDWYVTQK